MVNRKIDNGLNRTIQVKYSQVKNTNPVLNIYSNISESRLAVTGFSEPSQMWELIDALIEAAQEWEGK